MFETRNSKVEGIVDPDAMYVPKPAPDKAFSKQACLIHNFKFDPKGIQIDRNLPDELDPLCHVVLRAGRDALSDCATASQLNRERVGVALAAIALPTDAVTREILGRSFEERLFLKVENED